MDGPDARGGLRTRIETLPAEELTRLLGQLGHEVGTPLGSVLMMTEMIADSAASDDELRRRADGLRQAATEVRDVLGSFVRLVRLRTGWLSPRLATVDGDVIVRSIEAGVRRFGTSDVEVTAPATLPSGYTDLDFLRDAVESCCDWASRRAPISLAVGDDTGVSCVLRCSGPAVPWDQEAILDPLGRGDLATSRRHGGPGLQLALARMLVWRLGGELTGRFDDLAGQNVLTIWVPTHAADPLDT